MNQFRLFVRDLINHGLEYFGRWYSEYEAIVYDNNDPLSMGRVLLIIPEVTGEELPLGKWALPKGTGQSVPAKGDRVWVSFKYGNVKAPMYMAAYKTTKEIEAKLRGKDQHWIKTPKGSLIHIDDLKDLLEIVVEEQVNIKTKKVELGIDKLSPIAKGDKVKDVDTAIVNDYLAKVDQDLIVIVNAVNPLVSGALAPVLANVQARLTSTLPSIINKIEQIPSTNNKTS